MGCGLKYALKEDTGSLRGYPTGPLQAMFLQCFTQQSTFPETRREHATPVELSNAHHVITLKRTFFIIWEVVAQPCQGLHSSTKIANVLWFGVADVNAKTQCLQVTLGVSFLSCPS